MMGVFNDTAVVLHELGLNPIPLTPDKIPGVPWKHWQAHRMSNGALSKLRQRFPNHNVATVTGEISGITVIDVDDPKTIDDVIAVVGEPKILVQSPRKGFHLWFRYNGEATATKVGGKAVDVRARGGLIACPPSLNDNGCYRFVHGTWDDLGSLSTTKGALTVTSPLDSGSPVRVGERNSTLFRKLRECANAVHEYEALLSYAAEENLRFVPPLPIDEVARTARQIWKYKERWTLGGNGNQFVALGKRELDLARDDPMAFALLSILRSTHATGTVFPVSPKAMGDALSGWSKHLVRNALEKLLTRGMLIRVKQGGRYQGDASLYAFV